MPGRWGTGEFGEGFIRRTEQGVVLQEIEPVESAHAHRGCRCRGPRGCCGAWRFAHQVGARRWDRCGGQIVGGQTRRSADEGSCSGYLAHPASGAFHIAFLGGAVNANKPEFGAVPERPFEVVQGRPVEIATNIDAFCHHPSQILEGFGHKVDAVIIVVGRDAVFGHHHGNTGHLSGTSDRGCQGHRPAFISHLGHGNARFGAEGTASAHPRTGIGLYADEVVVAGRFEELVFIERLGPFGLFLTAGNRLDVGHCQGHSDRHLPRAHRDRCSGQKVGLLEVFNGLITRSCR